jgi:hypothetical protein
MTQPLIWIHEEALRLTHPVFNAAPSGTRAVFIWDDNYFRALNYSLKRLIFIYETLCELPVDILRGDAVSVIKELMPSRLYVPSTGKPHIILVIDQLKTITEVEIIQDEVFAQIPETTDFKRFFKYWSFAEKTASLRHGGIDA